MAFQTINLGTYANDGTGDDLRTAFTKVNDNFSLFSGEVTDGANLGAGTGIFANKTANLDFGNTLNFKSIVGGNNLTVTHDGSTITLAVNNPLVGNVTGNLTGNVTGNVSGNAGTVTNGVYTTGAYANPSWITSLAKSKVGLSNVENTTLSTWNGSTNITTVGVLTSLSVATTINSDLRGNVTGNVIGNVSGNAGTVTNGVYTNISYTNPPWIASLAGGKITGNISGNAGTVTNGVYTSSSIDALADVDTTTNPPTNGQALVWYSAYSKWGPGNPNTNIALNSLTDVDTVSLAPTNGQALVWYSAYSKWGPGTIAAGGVTKIIAGTNISISPTNGLGDVTISSTASGGGGGGGTLDFGTFTAPAGFTLDLGTF